MTRFCLLYIGVRRYTSFSSLCILTLRFRLETPEVAFGVQGESGSNRFDNHGRVLRPAAVRDRRLFRPESKEAAAHGRTVPTNVRLSSVAFADLLVRPETGHDRDAGLGPEREAHFGGQAEFARIDGRRSRAGLLVLVQSGVYRQYRTHRSEWKTQV